MDVRHKRDLTSRTEYTEEMPKVNQTYVKIGRQARARAHRTETTHALAGPAVSLAGDPADPSRS